MNLVYATKQTLLDQTMDSRLRNIHDTLVNELDKNRPSDGSSVMPTAAGALNLPRHHAQTFAKTLARVFPFLTVNRAFDLILSADTVDRLASLINFEVGAA
jgi:hypothetical protein